MLNAGIFLKKCFELVARPSAPIKTALPRNLGFMGEQLLGMRDMQDTRTQYSSVLCIRIHSIS